MTMKENLKKDMKTLKDISLDYLIGINHGLQSTVAPFTQYGINSKYMHSPTQNYKANVGSFIHRFGAQMLTHFLSTAGLYLLAKDNELTKEYFIGLGVAYTIDYISNLKRRSERKYDEENKH